MASFNYTTQQQPELSSLEQRADRQTATYWRVRVNATLARLEREARRMLQLEEDLSAFANQYYEAVGEVTERLAMVEQKISEAPQTASGVSEELTVTMPAVLAQRDARDARRSELKTRYRSLAKEIHPDRAMIVDAGGTMASHMHVLNAAYQHGDLAALLRLEAHMLLSRMTDEDFMNPTPELEHALREVERAADTYANGYRGLLSSPLNELMLRAMSARLAGWDWMQAVVRKVERTIEEKERAAVIQHIAAIGAWRDDAQVQAA